MQNLTFFDYQINEYGQNTLKTPKNIALHMKHQKHQKYKNHNNHNNRPLTCRKRVANVSQTFLKRVANISQTFNKHFANVSQSFQKIMQKIITPTQKMIYLLYMHKKPVAWYVSHMVRESNLHSLTTSTGVDISILDLMARIQDELRCHASNVLSTPFENF